MAKNLFKRYIWLVDTIYQAGRIDFDTINNKWKRSSLSDGSELPKKTFHNHKKAIQEVFDIIIECDNKDGYKYYIENPNDIGDNKIQGWLLNTFTINNLISESKQLKDRIHLEHIPSGQQHLTTIIKAMSENYCIKMAYQSYWRDSADTIQVEPYFVKIFKQRWYAIAYNREKQAMRTYALDRIKKLDIMQSKFEFPKDFNPSNYFRSCYGIIRDDKIDECMVKIKVTTSQAKYLRDLPLHHSQKEMECINEMSIFKFHVKPSFDFKKELLSMGAEVEVMEPKWFREELRMEVEIILNKYIYNGKY